ncbi:hypothetical protein P152DRAFT_458447 [Eremomyces bilateralis CBS 781.70]|uniref:Saccharopine dehydrogenase NADP binding domain-containing protein n=1 Tax=Eremomyces bilateralis CBS 781.70 TaxID=1392243 RepID=A0A6G1G3Z5_9PEZI|nr:uncharacterized protein P152DRAFT_458447 [Eremomyces bilateralis CBS 781.70]KAF1812626.1 hypothetical protein P152DRAFT_458447 [Eremomyces bilateralis CBS 781.70]
MADTSKQYDIVLLGATGFTGKLTAQHIAEKLPTSLRWAIAGRNAKKLDDVLSDLTKRYPTRTAPAVEVVDQNVKELTALARKTKLIISTVGPFHRHGTPVVEACATTGTHYIDSTGEAPWVKDMIDKYHDLAKSTGAIMIPQCGIDSVPSDLIAWALVELVRKKLDAGVRDVVNGVTVFDFKPSGGTLLTMLTLLESFSFKQLGTSMRPFGLSPVPRPRATATRPGTLLTKLFGYFRHPDIGTLTSWTMAATNEAIVGRSWGLFDGGKHYGGSFRFGEFRKVRNVVVAMIMHFGLAFIASLVAFPPARKLIQKLVVQPGSGPDPETTKGNRLEYRAVAVADTSPPRKALAKFSYEGDGYYFTGLLLAEAAMVVLEGSDKVAAKQMGGGILTPATLGDEYADRLRRVGVQLEASML